MNFWYHLPKPFFVLAPMEDVTDTVFRRVVAMCARPDVFFTEFANVDGMASVGRKEVTQRLRFTEKERPIVAQIWGLTPEHYYKAAREIVSLGFDGIDINMGCPEKKVVKKGACIALIKNRALAHEIILATKEGAGDLPVSIKTRIGFDAIATEDWIGFLLSHTLDALTVHGRTAKEQSSVPCHWDEIGKAVRLCDMMKRETLMIGNGDVADYTDALEKSQTYGVDGVMIGRGIFHNMWAFDASGRVGEHTKDDKLALLIQHARLFEKEWGDAKNFMALKKYFKIYVSGFDHAGELREKLMAASSVEEVEQIIKEINQTPFARGPLANGDMAV